MVKACLDAHEHMMGYLKMHGVSPARRKLAYATMWNEFIRSMREDVSVFGFYLDLKLAAAAHFCGSVPGGQWRQ